MASASSPNSVELRRFSGGLQAGPQGSPLTAPPPSSCSPVPTFHITPPLPEDPSHLHSSDDFDLELGNSSTECSVDYDDAFPRPPVLVSMGSQLAGFPSMDKISDCDSELANLLKDVHTPPEEQDVDFDDDVEDRSPVNRCGSCGSISASEDEEVGTTLERKSPAPLRFRSSPPRGVHKLNKRTISPKVFLASTVSPYSNPRFHRHHRLIQRPHLDFEKMQVTRNTRILYSVM